MVPRSHIAPPVRRGQKGVGRKATRRGKEERYPRPRGEGTWGRAGVGSGRGCRPIDAAAPQWLPGRSFPSRPGAGRGIPRVTGPAGLLVRSQRGWLCQDVQPAVGRTKALSLDTIQQTCQTVDPVRSTAVGTGAVGQMGVNAPRATRLGQGGRRDLTTTQRRQPATRHPTCGGGRERRSGRRPRPPSLATAASYPLRMPVCDEGPRASPRPPGGSGGAPRRRRSRGG